MNPDEFDRNLKALVMGYLKCLGDAEKEPPASVLGFIRLFLAYTIWAWTLTFVPFILLYRLARRVLGKAPQPEGPVLRFFLEPFRSLAAGEIPLLRLQTFRPVTTLVLARHIERRIETIRSYLSSEEIRALVSDDVQHLLMPTIASSRKLLSKMYSTVSNGTRFKFGLLALPVLSLIASKIDKESLDSLAKLGFSLPALWKWTLNNQYSIALIAAYGLWLFASAFIRKRELCLTNGIYSLEHSLLDGLVVRKVRECPWDLVGWLFLMPLVLLPVLIAASDFNQETGVVLGVLVFLAVIQIYLTPMLIYALYKRVRIDNR